MNIRSGIRIFVGLAAAAMALHGQIVTEFGGEKNSVQFAYGLPGIQFPALIVSSGNGVTGSSTITLVTGASVNSGGVSLNPVTTNTPITVGIGANAETVTPTAVSNCNLPAAFTNGPAGPNCTITASFSNLHGPGEPVASGTYGLQEAINRAHGQGGGIALIDGAWRALGGTNAIITAAAPYSNVFIRDNSVSTSANQFWSMQPSTLTVLAVPTPLTATNIVFTAATGTWAASSTHFSATCVDALGGESAQSADYTQTPTVNFTLTVPVPPTCATGSVGWRLYAGTTSLATSYLLPVTASNCALTTLETVFPACALTATGTWAATFTTTTNLAPVAIGATNTNNPVPQGHTTFAYAPNGNSVPVSFQSNFGPFGSGAIASATASDVTPLGSFELPTAYQNVIGRTVRVTGKIKLTAGASSTLGVFLGTVWQGGVTAGAPVPVCSTVSGFVWATAASVLDFSCTMTTNAVGATAIGTIQPESWFIGNTAAGTGTTSPTGVDTSSGTVGTLGLFAQNEYTVYVTPLVAADTTVQLMSLHI